MNDRIFIDTNVLIYAYDKHEPEKQKRAQFLLKEGIQNDNVVISSQVLSEFYCTVTKKILEPMSSDEAHEVIRHFKIFPVVEVDSVLVNRAIETLKQYHIPYWDSLIVAAAERAGCSKLLSEDFNSGQLYYEILAVDPFKTYKTLHIV